MAKTHLEPKSSTETQSMMDTSVFFFFNVFPCSCGRSCQQVCLQGRTMLGEHIQKGTIEKWAEGDKELGS